MTAREVIAQLKRDRTPIRLPNGKFLEAAKRAHKNAVEYAQFGKCFGGAVHYEIGNKGNSLCVLLDDEGIEGAQRDALRMKLVELAQKYGLTIPRNVGTRWLHIDLGKDVNCEGKTFQQIEEELGERFGELYGIFNETLVEFKKNAASADCGIANAVGDDESANCTVEIDEGTTLKALDFIEQLRRVQRQINFSGGVMPVLSDWYRHVRYCTDEMRAAFGGGIYYEVYSRYNDIYVELHDARGRDDELRKALERIVKQHSSYYYLKGKIGFCDDVRKGQECENRSLGGFKNAFSVVESRVKDMLAIFNPFFHDMCLALQNGGEEMMKVAAKNYETNIETLTAAEAINRIIDEHVELDVGNGEKLMPDCRDGYSKRFSYQIYKSYLEGDVHFEVLVRGSELSVELHDERRAADGKLRRAIRRIAERHDGLVVDTKWFSVRMQPGVAAGRGMSAIVADVERDMAELWDIYGKLFSCFVEQGESALQNADAIELPPMADVHEPKAASSAASRPRESTFSWVSTVEDLFNRKPFTPDGSRESFIPGDYVIPVYQRKYTWTEENVSTLCRDLLKAAAKEPSSYHLGTIILHADRESGDFFVVDGQQRLRTISRLLSQKIFREMAGTALGQKFTTADEARIWRTFMRFDEESQRIILGMLRKCTVVCIAVGDVSEAFQLFSTQNGRGKPLSPENLLKAFHFHELGHPQVPADVKNADEYIESWKDEIEENWESLNASSLAGEDRNLLGQVIGEHLYRIRCWLHGAFPDKAFSAKDVSAFKGLTPGKDAFCKLPIQNLAVMRIRQDAKAADELSVRSIDDKMRPFVFIDQSIANGADFFRAREFPVRQLADSRERVTAG